MVMFMDHSFCLCELLVVGFVGKPCNNLHDTDENYHQLHSSEVKL